MKLTAHMRDALERAKRDNGELRRVHKPGPGKPHWPANACTLAALVRHGLLEWSRRRNKHGWPVDVWALTDDGRLALDPPMGRRRDVVLSLRAKGNARMRVMVGGVWVEVSCPEPEPVRPEELSPSHGLEAQERWNRARDARVKAAARSRLTRGRRAA